MKKALVVLGLGLVLGGAAQAQTLNVGGTYFAPGGFGVNLGVAFNVTELGGNAVTARIGADVTRTAGVTGFSFNADALYNVPSDALNVYVGPSLGFVGGAGAGAFKVGAVLGANYAFDSQFGLFVEGFYNYVIGGGSFGGARLGLTYKL
ncbi:hypothetical protein [Deinococcus roseus]|uniref:Outer membrane protein beta-barrel domain-containing protein n=1 Tax=Deinococcus roseus TaxID=392414 RepID=A0ABQ2D810_9DEIO|nr:hypothetical protein [Deinococcus roseus]GGJ49144.1 hypothetical protein GCM10008938_38950 [Deinococcus roseus]